MKWILKIAWLGLCVLAGIGLVHFIHTKPPEQTSKPELLCDHQLQFSQCAFCDPTLVEKLGFCHGHGVPEAFCTRCSPFLIGAFQIEGDWCAEHKLPESQCKECKPTQIGEDEGKPQIPTGSLKLFKKIGFKSARTPNPGCNNEGLIIQFLNQDVARSVKLEFSNLIPSDQAEFSECNVQIRFDQNRLAQITPRAEGIISAVNKDLGEKVKTGEILASVHSNAFAQAKSEFLQATALFNLWDQNYKAELELKDSGATATREVLQSQTKRVEHRIAIDQAIQKLRNFGLSLSSIQNLSSTDANHSILEITAPFAATIIERHAVKGEAVEHDHSLFTIADTDFMWAELDLFPSQVHLVRSGDHTEILIPELAPAIFKGEINWIASSIDEHTRTLKARVVLENPDGLLKAGMFGKARVRAMGSSNGQLVPRSAVQWDGCCNVVFLRKSETRFETRKVHLRPSASMPDYYLLQESFPEDVQVVTTGSFLLKTELMKGEIGAGCCEVEPGR